MSLIAAGPGPLFIAPVNLLHGNHPLAPPPAPYSTSPLLYVLVAVAVVVFLAAVAWGAYLVARRNRSRFVDTAEAGPTVSAVVGSSST